MGQAFRWRRVGDEEVRQGDWGDPPARWHSNGGAWYSGVPGLGQGSAYLCPETRECAVGDDRAHDLAEQLSRRNLVRFYGTGGFSALSVASFRILVLSQLGFSICLTKTDN